MPSGLYDRQKYKNRPESHSGLKGVIFHPRTPKKPWKASIRKHGQYVTLGYFRTQIDAAMRYNREAIRFYGPEAYLNPLRPL